jgi:hypothetical protein
MFRLTVAVFGLVALVYVTFAPQQETQLFVPAMLPAQQMSVQQQQPWVRVPADYEMGMPVQGELYPETLAYAPVEDASSSWDALFGWALLGAGAVAVLAVGGQGFGAAESEEMEPKPSRVSDIRMASTSAPAPWGMKEITPDGKLKQRIEGSTRKTWKFNDLTKDRVQLEVTSEGRPVNAEVQLWLGPDWTPFSMKAYSEDGKLRPVHTLIGTRNKSAMIEVRNVGDDTFPFTAASNYAKGVMAELPHDIPANTPGERVDGGALRSYPIAVESEQVEVVLNTDGKQLNARVELLNAPNNPKQTFEIFTNNGELNSLVVCFNLPDAGNTVRILNLAPVEFPCYIHINEK